MLAIFLHHPRCSSDRDSCSSAGSGGADGSTTEGLGGWKKNYLLKIKKII
jgi:hypothetical protein